MPKVFNKYHGDAHPDAIDIMRPTIYGNPYSHQDIPRRHPSFCTDTREEAIEKYEVWLKNRPYLIDFIKKDLRGKDLVCCCKPHPCHGDVLIRIANEE